MEKSFEVIRYIRENGEDEIGELMNELFEKAKTSKIDRIRFKKIQEYIGVLETYGTRLGTPYTKHIRNGIYELRPTSDRIFFAYYKRNTFVLLHHIVKKRNTTPPLAIEQAEKNLADFLERNGE